jgi:predicted SnoaL-like aldol condensation-catalyzing enzyme
MKSKKQRTADIQKSLETREKFAISHFDSRKYIQHNLNLEDGLGPILAFMDQLPADNTRVEVKRMFEDGEYSFAHAEYVLGDWGAMVGFEIHRWEDDRIVEHWDNLQPDTLTPNPAGRTMADGASQVADLHKTAANKARAVEFTQAVLIERNLPRLPDFFTGGRLLQHSPGEEDGVAGLAKKLGSAAGSLAWSKVHKVLGEGNFVLVMSEGTSGGKPAALFNLYRFENDMIAEHWDVVEDIPPREAWKNTNGKF